MSIQIMIVLVLNFITSVITTLGYSVRIVGVRTRKIAVAGSVFNIFALIARTSGGFQAPFLAKTIENAIKQGNAVGLIYVFRWILFSSTAAAICGALLIPTFIKVFTKMVNSFSIYKSIPKILIHGFSKSGIEQFKNSITKPKKENIAQLKSLKNIPKKIIILNIIASSITIVGTLSASYAGCLNPALRNTCVTLSSIINGIATIIMFIFIDPFGSMLTDDVLRGECSEVDFNRYIIFIVCGVIIGTILAQILLLPSAQVIAYIAKIL